MKGTRVHSLRDDYREKLRERIRRHAAPAENGCMEWQAKRDRNGYGILKIVDDSGARRYTGAHRAAWLAFVGPIEGELVVDHLCRNVACVNVDHLRLVSHSENVTCGDHSNKKGRSGRVSGTPPGCGKHGMSDGRWYTSKDGYTRWSCRICNRANLKRFRERKRANSDQ